MIDSYMEEYDLSEAKKEEAIITAKVGEKSLFTPPAYFVRVQLLDGTESRYLHRISRQQMNNFKIGDNIEGFSIYGTFSTARDFLYDSFFFVVAIATFGFFSLLGLFLLITEIPAIERLIKKTFLGKPSKGNGMKFLTVVMIVFVYFSGRFLVNILRKMIPISNTKTEAIIIDEQADIGYRKHQDAKFEFTLSFQNRDGENVEVVKEVTKNTFDQFSFGDKIEISYRNSNPYDVFVNHTTLADITQSLFYIELLIYVGMLAVMVFTAYALHHWKKSQDTNTEDHSSS